MAIRHSKTPSRTKFNTEYMPWLEEDEIECNDPLELERLTDTRDIIKEDAERFRKLCRQNGFNFSELNREYERKLKLTESLRDELAVTQQQLAYAARYGWSQAKQKELTKEVARLESEINQIMNNDTKTLKKK